MRMNNRFVTARSWRMARTVLLHPKFHHGFTDFLAGRPFDYRLLDGWRELDQNRYENGREIAAECRAAGLVIKWTDRTRIPEDLKRLILARTEARNGKRPARNSAPAVPPEEGVVTF